jgi:hypothetical protein
MRFFGQRKAQAEHDVALVFCGFGRACHGDNVLSVAFLFGGQGGFSLPLQDSLQRHIKTPVFCGDKLCLATPYTNENTR